MAALGPALHCVWPVQQVESFDVAPMSAGQLLDDTTAAPAWVRGGVRGSRQDMSIVRVWCVDGPGSRAESHPCERALAWPAGVFSCHFKSVLARCFAVCSQRPSYNAEEGG